MAWYDRFRKYRHPNELRWIVFALAALAGLLILLMSGGIVPAQTSRIAEIATYQGIHMLDVSKVVAEGEKWQRLFAQITNASR